MADVSTLDLIIIIVLLVLFPFIALAIYPALFIILRKVSSPRSFYKAIYNPISNLFGRIKSFCIAKQNSKQEEIENKVIIESKSIPHDILKMLHLSGHNEVLFACRLFPYSTLMINEKKNLKTLLLMTKDYVYLLGFVACRDKYEDIERIPLLSILNIEAKTKEGKILKKPFISVNTTNNVQYKFFFFPAKSSKNIISKILNAFKIATNNIEIKFDVPEDIRSDAFKVFENGAKDFNKQMKEEMTKDLKDIFK